jgi:hypothetical protein
MYGSYVEKYKFTNIVKLLRTTWRWRYIKEKPEEVYGD